MYNNYHVKALPEIFTTYLLSIAQARNSHTQSKLFVLIVQILTASRT